MILRNKDNQMVGAFNLLEESNLIMEAIFFPEELLTLLSSDTTNTLIVANSKRLKTDCELILKLRVKDNVATIELLNKTEGE